MQRRRSVRILRTIVLALVVLLILAQLVPYGCTHRNPPVKGEPPFDATTRALAVRACFDCHSNQTKWPWYSYVAPMSWLVQHHVDEGREELNFSEWPHSGEGDEAGEDVRDGSMPPRSYLWMHSEARLTPAEREQLARGLDAVFGARHAD